VQNTAGGFVASFLTFDNKSPDPQLLEESFSKVLGDDADMVYIDDVYWYGDFINKNNYRKNNNAIKKSITKRISGDDGDSIFNLGYLDSFIKIVKGIDKSTDEGYGKILQTQKAIKLLQSLKEPIKKATGGLVEKPKFYFGRLIDIYNL